MSLKTKIIITCALVVLAFLFAYRGYVVINGFMQEDSATKQEETFDPFNQPITDEAPADGNPEALSMAMPESPTLPVATKEQDMVKPFFGQMPEQSLEESLEILAQKQKEKQADLDEKISKYTDTEIMQSFVSDLREIVGEEADFKSLMGQDFEEKFLSNPKVREILLKYSKEPAFARVMQEMMSDKELMTAFVQTPAPAVEN